jgi:hypothetical protein
MENPKFDAALGTIYRKSGVIDVIRIYDEKFEPDNLAFIRTKYLQAIDNLIK